MSPLADGLLLAALLLGGAYLGAALALKLPAYARFLSRYVTTLNQMAPPEPAGPDPLVEDRPR